MSLLGSIGTIAGDLSPIGLVNAVANKASGGALGFDPTPGFSAQNVLSTQARNLVGSGSSSSPSHSLGSNPTSGGTAANNSNNPYTGGDGSGGGSSGSGSGGTDYSAQLASLAAQQSALQGTLGMADTQEQQGLQNLQDQYNQQNSAANTNHSRALQDFQTTEQNDNTGHQQAIDQVNTKARTLANSVRQMIGNASGSGSSAYQLTAPGAVQRQADLQSQGINDNFGQNMTTLTTSKQREGEDYNGLLSTLADTLAKGQNGLRTGIESQKQQINGQLADLAAQRAAYAGGGVAGAAAAASPFQANATAAQQAIQNIASQYQSPFSSIKPVSVAAPTLRDYVTGQTNVATNPAGTQTTDVSTYNPLATWNKQDQNQYAF